MNAVVVVVGGVHPVEVTGYRLEGYHRPLGGEGANLTVVCAPTAVPAPVLTYPPLGAPGTVRFDDDLVLFGYLAGVDVSADAVQLRIEG
ncbi:MAG: hypothetical protein P9F19_01490 [Candidatus Contendobacter sp.]|nr:hypothetical protein [Candidatus Contendobacter sp.]MDG4556063.1 hypothetical protein [Candidatus Contendobacter sp.]